MKYYVGDIAKLLNITPGALRFYEDKKIIDTKKTDSFRRYYDDSDILRLLSLKKYASMGIPLKQISQQFSGESRHVIGRRLQGRAVEARNKAEYYKFLAEIIEKYSQQIEEIDSFKDGFKICVRPEMYILSDTEGQLMSKDTKVQGVIQQWVQGIPATRYAFLKENEMPDDSEIFLGYVIASTHAHYLKLPLEHDLVRCVSENVCLRAIVDVNIAIKQQDELFSGINDCLSKNNMKPCGVSVAEIIVVESTVKDGVKSYLDVTVPFQLHSIF